MREVFAEYAARKAATNVIDFDDLLLYWRALAVAPAGGHLRGMFDHVLVDEVQDVNVVQGDILARTAATSTRPSPRSATTRRPSTASAPPRPR